MREKLGVYVKGGTIIKGDPESEDFVPGLSDKTVPSLASKLPDLHPSDPWFYRKHFKRLGILDVNDELSLIQINDESGNVLLQAGDRILELILQPVPLDKRPIREPLRSIQRSMELLARYIELQSLTPTYIVGFTYEKLGGLSTHLGFSLNTNLPPVLREKVKRTHAKLVRRDLVTYPMGTPTMIFQTREDFLNRFGSKRN